jgi:4-hydroxybenzoate polyprenyltransferase
MSIVTTYWFKPKRYGYGATPVTWQGWLVTLATIFVVMAASLLLPTIAPAAGWLWLAVLAIDALAVVALLIVSRRKTKGEWRWRWGG